MPVLLSIVVLGFRNFSVTTLACLDSLLPWIDDPEIELIVVDNGSDDASPQLTGSWCARRPRVRCLLSSENRGFAGGMNWGAQHAAGTWLLLANNDTQFPAGTIDALKRVLGTAGSKLAMLGPVTNAAGNGQRLWKPGTDVAGWLEVGRWLHAHPSGELVPAYRCDFFCIAIRNSVWQELGGLDLAFGLGYYEDFDFSLRLAQAGYQQAITEDVFVLHSGSATFNGSAAARDLMRRNKKLLQAKHPNALFEHTRLGNLAVIRHYMELKAQGKWSAELEARFALRVGALRGDGPRSVIKKWLWKFKIKSVLAG
jgi:GT2 family glycosyltransferase